MHIDRLRSKEAKGLKSRNLGKQNFFFQKSYVSISSNPPTQYISNYKQLVVPTHPLFCLRNIWMAPKHKLMWLSITITFILRPRLFKPRAFYFVKHIFSNLASVLGPSIYYVSKIVGGWVPPDAYNCLYTGWVSEQMLT